MTKFEKETRYEFYVFIRKTTVNLVKCQKTAHPHDVFCPLIQAWHVNFPFNCPITQPSYTHDAYTVLLVLKSGWWYPITFKNFVIVFINKVISPCFLLIVIWATWNCWFEMGMKGRNRKYYWKEWLSGKYTKEVEQMKTGET